jgi:diadenosine tetraphosphate (Ap4A) HIT family hydrolase
MTLTKHNCDFCDEFRAGVSNAFHTRYGESLRDRVVFATENFRVFPSIGQLAEGYLLIAPVEHYRALDEMPDEILGEFAHVYEKVRTTLFASYGPSLFFEHGARSERSGGCGIYHAHLHAVPFPTQLDPVDFLKSRFPFKEIRDLTEIRMESDGLSAYLLYRDSHGTAYVFKADNLPSQYMRKLLAQALGEHEWDWRHSGKEERLLATLSSLSMHFENASTPVAPPEVTNDALG